MQPWVWHSAKDILKNIKQLEGKDIVIKHNTSTTYHTYVNYVLKAYLSNATDVEHGTVFCNEDFWADIYPEDEVMILE